MWVRSMNGGLVNLEVMQSIEIAHSGMDAESKKQNCTIRARVGSGAEYCILISTLPQEEAEYFVDIIAQRIGAQEPFLDLRDLVRKKHLNQGAS